MTYDDLSKIRPLTVKEKNVLKFIESYMRENEVSPSYQDIQEHFQFRSINSVQSYLKQLQNKGYIKTPGGNQKRAIILLHSTQTVSSFLGLNKPSSFLKNDRTNPFSKEKTPVPNAQHSPGSFSLPLLGRVAAGQPIEALEFNEYVEVPSSLVKNPQKTFALKVEGQSMIEDGILDGDIIFVQQQSLAHNGEIIVAIVNNEATVKRFYFHSSSNSENKKVIHAFPQPSSHSWSADKKIELRPSNSEMSSMWFSPDEVEIRGVVVGLIRNYN